MQDTAGEFLGADLTGLGVGILVAIGGLRLGRGPPHHV